MLIAKYWGREWIGEISGGEGIGEVINGGETVEWKGGQRRKLEGRGLLYKYEETQHTF